MKWTGAMDVHRSIDADAETGEIRRSNDFFVLDVGISKSFDLSNGLHHPALRHQQSLR